MPAAWSSFARRTPSKLAPAPSAAGAAGVGRGAPTPGGASAGFRRTGSADIAYATCTISSGVIWESPTEIWMAPFEIDTFDAVPVPDVPSAATHET